MIVASVDHRDPDRPLGVECPSGHVAATPPHVFEEARRTRLLRELHAWFADRDREGLSEDEVAAVLDAPGLLLLRTDRHRRITWVSQSLVDSVGWSRSDLVGRTVASFLDPDYRAATEAARDAFYEAGGSSRWHTFAWRTPDGGRRIVSGLPVPVRDDEGLVSGSVSVLRDVTTESEAGGLLRGVLDSMLDPLAVMSPVYDAAGALSDLVYVAVNKAACTRLGLDEELLVGGTMRGVFPSRAADFVAAACASGATVVRGAAELRVKESDRIATMATGLRALGIVVDETPDGATIHGGALRGGSVESHGDHRIAMAFAVAAQLADGEVRIGDVANVATSFPGFDGLARVAGMQLDAG